MYKFLYAMYEHLAHSTNICLLFHQGGTGYASVNDTLEGKHERPVLQA